MKYVHISKKKTIRPTDPILFGMSPETKVFWPNSYTYNEKYLMYTLTVKASKQTKTIVITRPCFCVYVFSVLDVLVMTG